MTNIKKVIVMVLSLTVIFAIKSHYGGEISIRLNEPNSFSFNPSNYSNLIFYSLIYENFFYLRQNGEIFSNIFDYHKYEKSSKTVLLVLKKNLSFSNGHPITIKNIKVSLKLFLDLNLSSSRKLRRIIKNIRSEGNNLYLELLYDYQNIISLLTVPELVLLSGDSPAFSGIFIPNEWEKNKYILLQPNKYYSGGRAYLDSVKIVFFNFYYPDVFLSNPGSFKISEFKEYNSGVYQNIYLCFPKDKVGQNTRIALYSLLKEFYQSIGLKELDCLTSEDESPISINIKRFSKRKVKSILKYSKIKLYIISSLNYIEKDFMDFLKKKGIKIEIVYVDNNQLSNFLKNTSIKYLLIEKVFNKITSLEDKVIKIIKEMSFSRFNEKYLKLIDELDEIRNLNDSELLIEHISKILEKIIDDGFILPLYQKRYAIYLNNKHKNIEIDAYERPLFHKVRIQ